MIPWHRPGNSWSLGDFRPDRPKIQGCRVRPPLAGESKSAKEKKGKKKKDDKKCGAAKNSAAIIP